MENTKNMENWEKKLVEQEGLGEQGVRRESENERPRQSTDNEHMLAVLMYVKPKVKVY